MPKCLPDPNAVLVVVPIIWSIEVPVSETQLKKLQNSIKKKKF